MGKHTQTNRRQFADELFECVLPFCGIGAKKINILGVDKTDKAEDKDKTT